MFDESSKLFCNRRYQVQGSMKNEGLSQRYTLITLLGLRAAEAAGMEVPFDRGAILFPLLEDTSWIDNVGDLGLLLWACTELAPERVPALWQVVIRQSILKRYQDACDRTTTSLAWLLTGLCYATTILGKETPALHELTWETYSWLSGNQGPHGSFDHVAQHSSMTGMIRGHIGSFADQVYPIVALSCFARVYGVEKAAKQVERCANAICEEQGTLGQWWWHYDSNDGRVFERYPVFSVHQDGMAPMALYAAQECLGTNFEGEIQRGLNWIFGENELGVNLCDPVLRIIWRSIYPKNVYRKYANQMSALLGATAAELTPDQLAIRRECRPYHFGWLLYAFAGRF
jgi:hypothetical protein